MYSVASFPLGKVGTCPGPKLVGGALDQQWIGFWEVMSNKKKNVIQILL